MALIRGIDASKPKQVIFAGITQIAKDLGISAIAEGIETSAELAFIQASGVHLIQGYLLAKPQFRGLPEISWPTAAPS